MYIVVKFDIQGADSLQLIEKTIELGEGRMDFHSISVTKAEVDLLLAEAAPAEPAGMVDDAVEDACTAYQRVRPILEIALPILTFLYPPGAAALATTRVILDKACKDSEGEGD